MANQKGRTTKGNGNVETAGPGVPAEQTSYAAMLQNKAPAAELGSSMTVLVPAAKAATVTRENENESASGFGATGGANEDSVRPSAKRSFNDEGGSNTESAAALDVEMDENGQTVKRQHDSSSTEDEGFSRVTRSRKVKKDDDALEIIASSSAKPKDSGKSRSKN